MIRNFITKPAQNVDTHVAEAVSLRYYTSNSFRRIINDTQHHYSICISVYTLALVIGFEHE